MSAVGIGLHPHFEDVRFTNRQPRSGQIACKYRCCAGVEVQVKYALR